MSLSLEECEIKWYGAIEMSYISFCTNNADAVNCPDMCPPGVDLTAEENSYYSLAYTLLTPEQCDYWAAEKGLPDSDEYKDFFCMLYAECQDYCADYDYVTAYAAMSPAVDYTVECTDHSSDCSAAGEDYVCAAFVRAENFMYDPDGEAAGNFCAP